MERKKQGTWEETMKEYDDETSKKPDCDVEVAWNLEETYRKMKDLDV